MAVSINVQAFRESIPVDTLAHAAKLRLGDIESVGGGVQAVVRDGDVRYQPWIGIVDRSLAAECECSPTEPSDMCVHAVAVALAAFDGGVAWSGAATPPSKLAVNPEHATFHTAVRRLAPRQLTALVVNQAARDRLFAATLLRQARMLDAADPTGLADFKAVLRHASNATTGRWQIHDVETAGRRLAAEVEILCTRPATLDMLDQVEQAIMVWDELAGYLIDAYYDRNLDPEEISEPLVQAHRDLCQHLELDPSEIAERLSTLLTNCHNETITTDAHRDLRTRP